MLQFDPFSPQIDADPFPLYKRLRDEAPCFWSPEANMWVLSRFADVAVALQDWATYSSASGNMMTELPDRAGATLGTTDPPRHDRLRALVQYAFLRRNLEGLADPIREIARGAAEELRGVEQFDFKDYSAKFTVRVLMAALGLPTGDEAIVDEETVREKAVLMVQSDPVTRAKGPEHLAAFHWMQDYATKAIAMRRASPRNDLISNFAAAEIDGDKLSEREVLLTTTTLIMAGVESLGGFMMMFGLNLADHAEARKAVASDPALLPDAIEESLRYNTSAQRFRRQPDARRRIARPDDEDRRLRLSRLWLGQSRRAPVPRSRPLRHRAQAEGPSRLRRRRPRLPRRRRSQGSPRRSRSRNSTRSSPIIPGSIRT